MPQDVAVELVHRHAHHIGVAASLTAHHLIGNLLRGHACSGITSRYSVCDSGKCHAPTFSPKPKLKLQRLLSCLEVLMRLTCNTGNGGPYSNAAKCMLSCRFFLAWSGLPGEMTWSLVLAMIAPSMMHASDAATVPLPLTSTNGEETP